MNVLYLNEIFTKVYKTILHVAIEKRNTELVQLVLNYKNLDINIYNIFKYKKINIIYTNQI